MAKRSDKTPVDTIRRKLAPKVVDWDFLLYEGAGEDPQPRVELPEDVDVATVSNVDTDALGSVYPLDDEDGEWVAVAFIAVKANSASEAAKAMLERAGEVVRELLGADVEDV